MLSSIQLGFSWVLFKIHKLILRLHSTLRQLWPTICLCVTRRGHEGGATRGGRSRSEAKIEIESPRRVLKSFLARAIFLNVYATS